MSQSLIRSWIDEALERASTMNRADARLYLICSAGLPLGALVHGIWAVIFWYLDAHVVALWDVGSTILFLSCWWLILKGHILIPGVILPILVEIPLRAALATYYIGYEAGFWVFIFVSVVSSMVMAFLPVPARIAVGFGFAAFAFVTIWMTYGVPPPIPLDQTWTLIFLFTNLLSVAAVLMVILVIFDRAVFRAETALSREFDRAERLLKNILPDAIALRLKDGEHLIADDHPDVSVIFADIVNFTEASAKLRPAELVETLNLVFTAFDKLAARHGAEKIKTIGDAYMAVVGVPDAKENHAAVAVELALDMLSAARTISAQTHFPIDLRIGVNSGPVVAGVIGESKFAYDLWGDAVNVAARMESHGTPGQLLITQATRDLLPEGVQVHPAGTRDVKGKGEMPVFSLNPAG